jgi:4-azaleucine resistance transporter AzlC
VTDSPTSRFREFTRGVVDIAPLMLGVVPFGLIFGVTVNAAQLSAIPAQATSSIIFAGSSQLVFARLFGEGAPWLTIILTAAILNLRHVLYSASIAPFMRNFSRGWKWLCAYLLTDEAYAIAINHFNTLDSAAQLERLFKHWYFFGCGITLWMGWNISTAIGIFVGGQIPASWALDFSVPLTFIAIVVPALRDRASVAAAVTAGIVSIAAYAMPLKLGLVSATLAGIAAGVIVERIASARRAGEAG